MKEIKIKLNPEQRFLIESQNDCAILLADEIEISPSHSQVILSGAWVDYDPEKVEFKPGKRHKMLLDVKESDVWPEDDE
ncbi:hypothetical protein M5X00_16650 [Paenibacillus alvei]|uniref:Uncharacterized protein n=1 Tax=Paenibacillus alvei TaxID=44250 RepID=A0ABT4H7M6_PAEAL|nr:hypothetical protein [Paenibacillus alvei]EJW17589.1 hypothetical protein PAV_3c00340 [Paenibacillus alvei DSM 29]MCY7485406.1 hypothetical protein [Paenibacillus alvei]MCY9544516.1 hypothetical protein [Paenibacillus alvei]MCY9706965.1 hypothetical protein [Paenibacillus alvei]MCY9736065.1 hypothetical protein [Paenibacillus alvei]